MAVISLQIILSKLAGAPLVPADTPYGILIEAGLDVVGSQPGYLEVDITAPDGSHILQKAIPYERIDLLTFRYLYRADGVFKSFFGSLDDEDETGFVGRSERFNIAASEPDAPEPVVKGVATFDTVRGVVQWGTIPDLRDAVQNPVSAPRVYQAAHNGLTYIYHFANEFALELKIGLLTFNALQTGWFKVLASEAGADDNTTVDITEDGVIVGRAGVRSTGCVDGVTVKFLDSLGRYRFYTFNGRHGISKSLKSAGVLSSTFFTVANGNAPVRNIGQKGGAKVSITSDHVTGDDAALLAELSEAVRVYVHIPGTGLPALSHLAESWVLATVTGSNEVRKPKGSAIVYRFTLLLPDIFTINA